MKEKKTRAQRMQEQLGMPFGTARNILHKKIMFNLVCKLQLNTCHQCGKQIEKVEDFSVEHIIPWLYSENPEELFFDIDNISFSHFSCNSAAARKLPMSPHGSVNRYSKHGCRCEVCVKATSDRYSNYYTPEKRKERYKRTKR